MDNLNLSDFYNHEKLLKDAREGNKIINNTNFKKYRNDRIEALKSFKAGDIYKVSGRAYNIKIVKKIDDMLIVQSVTNSGRPKKGLPETFENPVILLKNIICKIN